MILALTKYIIKNWSCMRMYSDEAGMQVCKKIVNGLKEGNRGVLASAITLIETENSRKKKVARMVLDHVIKECNNSKTFRIGISGPPGAGKSTFIEMFGKFLTQNDKKIAVLAVDPSSSTTGGSLLGDKTRMPELSRDKKAYIRPSPARGCLGGVTRSTNEAIILCEYAGYDIILVETVGVGQSEDAVANMVDIFILLLPPASGDDLQAVKRGIVEKADLIVVTKSDGDLIPAARRAQYEYTASLKFMRSPTPNWKTKVLRLSSKTKEGLNEFWSQIENFQSKTQDTFMQKRINQKVSWTWTHIKEGFEELLFTDPELKSKLSKVLKAVRSGDITPGAASDEILGSVKLKLERKDSVDKIVSSSHKS